MKALLLITLLSLAVPAMSAESTKKISFDHPDEVLLKDLRQMTMAGQRAGEGYFSHDGELMIFQSERYPENPFFQIYLMDLKTGDTNLVSSGIGKTTCAWIHPNKEKVLFGSTHLDPDARRKQFDEYERRRNPPEGRSYSWDFDEHYDIFETSLEGKNANRLTTERGYDAEASWSPDGSKIIFASNRNAFTEELSPEEQEIFDRDPGYMMDLYIMDADGTNVKQLTTTRGYDGGPFFSPDGQRVVWRRFTPDGRSADVFTINIDGTDEKRITNLGVVTWAPFYHPSGDYLIFGTNLQGHSNFELYMIDVEGAGEIKRVSYDENFDSLPVFIPGTDKISWTSTRATGKAGQIFTATWNDALARHQLGLTEIRPDLGQTSYDVNEEDVKLHVNYLASEALEGRFTGSKGARLATEYAAKVFRNAGLEPFGEDGSYFHTFEFTAGVSLGDANALTAMNGETQENLATNEDWRPLSFSNNAELELAEIVFAGYGLVAPKDGDIEAYDSYTHLDAEGKWVMMFRYVPENVSAKARMHYNRYGQLRRKAMEARNRGAKGIIVVSGPNSNVNEEMIALKLDVSSAGASIGGITITDATAEKLLAGTGKALKTLQDQLDTGAFVAGFSLQKTLKGQIELIKERKTGRNVLARLPAGQVSRNILLVGAHIDHLGAHDNQHKVVNTAEEIFYGADDNASGTSGVLELAQYFANKKAKGELTLEKDMVFALWSGEELGLLGSTAFAEYLGSKKKSASASIYPYVSTVLNMDMIGRLRDELIIQAVGSSTKWPALMETMQVRSGMRIKTQEDPYLPTDSAAFYLKGVPTLNAFTGSHEEYHTPADKPDTLNYPGIVQVTNFMGLIAEQLATSAEIPDYRKIENSGTGTGFRVYLGTIPDYTNTEVQGVLLSGVKPGSPAEAAGLKEADVIVELAGISIENIYDYTYALAALKVGVPVFIILKRGSERVEVSITPASRD